MDYHFVNLDFEKRIKSELADLLEADIINKIMKEGKIGHERNYYRSLHEGHSFKVTENLLPQYYSLCQSAVASLEFNEPIDFYITNDSNINAVALAKLEEDESHLVILNSGLIERFDEDELKFVVGHEIGHLINKNAEFKRIVQFVFPDFERMPLIFRHKLALWERLSEISADRYGYIASPNFDKCITNFFKLASGLSDANRLVNTAAYMAMVDEAIQKFQDQPLADPSSHPVHPVRVKALQYFSQSKLFRQISEKKPLQEDQDLQGKINQLVHALITIKNSELDVHRAYFVASAGLLVAMADQKIVKEEVENIVDVLSNLEVFPRVFLQKIIESAKIQEIFVGSAMEILKMNPGERVQMFDYMIQIALRDREIKTEEINFLYDVGQNIFHFEKKEIAQRIGKIIQERFMPKLFL